MYPRAPPCSTHVLAHGIVSFLLAADYGYIAFGSQSWSYVSKIDLWNTHDSMQLDRSCARLHQKGEARILPEANALWRMSTSTRTTMTSETTMENATAEGLTRYHPLWRPAVELTLDQDNIDCVAFR